MAGGSRSPASEIVTNIFYKKFSLETSPKTLSNHIIFVNINMQLYIVRMTFVFPQLPGVMFYVRLIDQPPINNHICLKNLNRCP